MTNRNRTYQNERVSTHSNVQCRSVNRQTSFLGRGNAKIKLSFSKHITDKFRRFTILQLNIEGLTASMILHHLAMQSEALVIIMQETYCPDAEKLVLPNYKLAGSSLSRKHGLATFVIDSVLNDTLRMVTGCLRPTPMDDLPVLSSIQPAELCQLGATFSLVYGGSLDPDHILYGLLIGSSETCQLILRSRRPFVPAARNLLDNLTRLGIRAPKWTNHK